MSDITYSTLLTCLLFSSYHRVIFLTKQDECEMHFCKLSGPLHVFPDFPNFGNRNEYLRSLVPLLKIWEPNPNDPAAPSLCNRSCLPPSGFVIWKLGESTCCISDFALLTTSATSSNTAMSMSSSKISSYRWTRVVTISMTLSRFSCSLSASAKVAKYWQSHGKN